MRNRTTLLTAAAAAAILAAPAMAQVGVDVGSTTDVGATVQTPPASGNIDAVQDTVDSTRDTAEDAVDTATDTAADAADQAADATPDANADATVSAELKAGAEVRDPAGDLVGTVESVSAEGAVVATGESRVVIPANSFAKNDRGLVIALTRTELDAAAKAAADPT